MSDSPALRKARGAFFTPPELCRYVARWAIRDAGDRVFEPSCGDAEFLLAAGKRLADLGPQAPCLAGVELHEASTVAAEARLAEAGLPGGGLRTGDFLDFDSSERYEAVIGNPPYVRYQSFAGVPRAKSRALALRYHVPLSGLASSWAAFTVHATNFLTDDGRLGLVLPAELLTVNYAAPVRSFLLRRFARVRLVLFEERVFPGVLEEVVLLLAEGSGGTDHFELVQAADLADLEQHLTSTTWAPPVHDAKWLGALLSVESAAAYARVTEGPAFTTLERWGDTTLGMVTGDNNFFTLTPQRAHQLRLRDDELLAISPPGSRHLRALTLTKHRWNQLGETGAATLLFRPSTSDPRELSPGAQRLIAAGAKAGVPSRYKCRVRSPWWRVPLVAAPDLFFTYMNNAAPQLATNTVQAHHLNSVHGVHLHPDLKTLGQSVLPLAALSTISLLGAELVGRAYGGGMLKLEPKEADLLPVPTPALLKARTPALTRIRRKATALLTAGDLPATTALVDEALLGDMLTGSELEHLRLARERLWSRRRARNGPRS